MYVYARVYVRVCEHVWCVLLRLHLGANTYPILPVPCLLRRCCHAPIAVSFSLNFSRKHMPLPIPLCLARLAAQLPTPLMAKCNPKLLSTAQQQ